MPVVALLAPHVGDSDGQVCLLSSIEEMPREILEFIQKRVPTFQWRSSLMAGSSYFANTCPKCHVIYGDFFLHSEPGAPFFPTSDEEAESLYLAEIQLPNAIEIQASRRVGVGDLILSNGKRTE